MQQQGRNSANLVFSSSGMYILHTTYISVVVRPDYYCRFVEIWRKLKTNCGNCSDIVWSIRSSRIGSFILDFIYGSDYFNVVIYTFIFFQIVCKRKRFAEKSLIFLHILAIVDTTLVNTKTIPTYMISRRGEYERAPDIRATIFTLAPRYSYVHLYF